MADWTQDKRTEKQVRLIAGIFGVPISSLKNLPETKGDASRLIESLKRPSGRGFRTSDDPEVVALRSKYVGDGPKVAFPNPKDFGLEKKDFFRMDTLSNLSDGVAIPVRRRWAKERGIDTARVRSWSWDTVVAACVHFEVPPVPRTHAKTQAFRRALNAWKKAQSEPTEPTPTPTPKAETPAPTGGNGISQEVLERAITSVVTTRLAESEKAAVEAAESVAEKLEEIVAALRAEMEEAMRPDFYKVQHADGKVVEVKGAAHVAMQEVLDLADMRYPVLLIGPSGSGKTHLAKQVAEALFPERDIEDCYGMVNCTEGMSESKLEGARLPGPDGSFGYVPTQFIHVYENGGVFLIDEIDAADPNVLLMLNAAIANDHMSIPKRAEKPVAYAHKDFVLIASSNTYGTGASRLYVGRNQLDEATIDRFRMGQVELDYDRKLEAMLVPDKTLLNTFWTIRDRADKKRVQRIVSTRSCIMAHRAMVEKKWTLNKCLSKLAMGWTPEELSKCGLQKRDNGEVFLA